MLSSACVKPCLEQRCGPHNNGFAALGGKRLSILFCARVSLEDKWMFAERTGLIGNRELSRGRYAADSREVKRKNFGFSSKCRRRRDR